MHQPNNMSQQHHHTQPMHQLLLPTLHHHTQLPMVELMVELMVEFMVELMVDYITTTTGCLPRLKKLQEAIEDDKKPNLFLFKPFIQSDKNILYLEPSCKLSS